MKKIRVLHRAATTGIGGVEKYVLSHYKYIDKEKYQFDFITRNQQLEELQEIKTLGMGVRTFTARQQDNKELLIKQITDIFDEGYDVLHMNTSVWAGFLIEELAMQRQIPKVIVHSHNTGVDFPTPEKRKYYTELHEYYKKRFGREHATHFCACSQEAADWMFGPQIPREEIRILKNAIEVEKYTYNVNKRNEVRRKYDLDDCFVIGHIGRFSYQKNHAFLIDVFSEIYKENSNARLLLIGKGELENEIEKQISERGVQDAVLVLGWQDDVSSWLQAMDIFLLPSRFEGLGIVAIEAQAAGLPCILSTNIPNEVLITEDVEKIPLEKEMWKTKIKKYMDGFERKNTEACLSRAGYNIKEAVKILTALYE